MHTTRKVLSARFWWRGLADDVRAFCWDCYSCQKVAGGTTQPRPLGEQIVPEKPGHVVAFDYLTLPLAEGGMRYLLVLKHAFSLMTKLVPCRAADAETAADALLDWSAQYGTPGTLISDCAAHFRNRLVEEVNRFLQTEHHFTTPYASQSNGGVERVNKSILRVLRLLVSENRMEMEHWPRLLHALAMVLNHSPSPRLGGEAPITVMSGITAVHPLDNVCRLTERSGTNPSPRLKGTKVDMSARARKHVKDLRALLDTMHTKVAKKGRQLRAANRKRSKYRHRMHGGFEVGDYVLIARVLPDKLQCRWQGPMRVVRACSDWTFEVESLTTGRRLVRHADAMRTYRDRYFGVTEELKSQIMHDDAVYLVQDLLQWRQNDVGDVEVEVQWVGLDQSSFEPFATLAQDVPARLKAFCDRWGPVRGAAPLRAARTAAGLD